MADETIDAIVHQPAPASMDLPPTDDGERRANYNQDLTCPVTEDKPAKVVAAEQQWPEMAKEMFFRQLRLSSADCACQHVHREWQAVHLGVQGDDPCLRDSRAAPLDFLSRTQDAKNERPDDYDVKGDKAPIVATDAEKVVHCCSLYGLNRRSDFGAHAACFPPVTAEQSGILAAQ